MKPSLTQLLQSVGGRLMGEIAPLMPTDYARADAQVLAVLLLFAAQESDQGIDILYTENQAMRALFATAHAVIDDPELKGELATASRENASLLLSALEAENARLRSLLIRLQAHAEERGLPAIESAIWEILKTSAARRLLRLS